MKKPSSELFELVKRLNLSERRYCTLYLEREGAAGKRYLQYFRLLKVAPAYDPEAMKVAMKLTSRPADYAVLKQQLFAQLLHALHLFDTFSNPVQQLFRQINECHLLMQKGLFASAEKRLKSAEKTAQRLDQQESLWQIRQLRLQLMARAYYRGTDDTDLQRWNESAEQVLAQLQQIQRYKFLGSTIYRLQYQSGSRGAALAEKMKPLMDSPELKVDPESLSLEARLDYWQCHALYAFTRGENALAATFNRSFLQQLDQIPEQKALHADRYFSVLNNYLIDCLLLEAFDLLEKGLIQLRALPGTPGFRHLVNIEANVFRLSTLLELNYLLRLGRFSEVVQQGQALTERLQHFGDRVVKHNHITILYLLAYAAFGAGNYPAALGFIRPVLQEKEHAVAENLQSAARLLQAVCHFELRDYSLVESLVAAARRLLRKGTETSVEAMVLKFLSAAIKRSPDWKKFENALREAAEKPGGKDALNLFDYRVWASMHINRKTFAECWNSQEGDS